MTRKLRPCDTPPTTAAFASVRESHPTSTAPNLRATERRPATKLTSDRSKPGISNSSTAAWESRFFLAHAYRFP